MAELVHSEKELFELQCTCSTNLNTRFVIGRVTVPCNSTQTLKFETQPTVTFYIAINRPTRNLPLVRQIHAL